MNKDVGIIVDSTVYLSKDDLKEHDIDVVSLNVLEGDNEYREVDITPDFIFEQQEAGKKFTTAQPSPESFKEAFEKKFKQGYKKLMVIVISKGISGTYQSALLGRDAVDRASDIHVFDTNNAGFGNELLALKLIELVQANTSYEKIIEIMDQAIESAGLFFTVENLFSLQRGGRLSKTQALLGTVLRVRPIIRLNDEGKLKLVHKERTQKKMLSYIVKRMQEDIGDKKKLVVRLVNQRSEDSLAQLKRLLEDVFKNVEITINNYIGPVFSIHIGKKGFGVTWYALD